MRQNRCQMGEITVSAGKAIYKCLPLETVISTKLLFLKLDKVTSFWSFVRIMFREMFFFDYLKTWNMVIYHNEGERATNGIILMVILYFK